MSEVKIISSDLITTYYLVFTQHMSSHIYKILSCKYNIEFLVIAILHLQLVITNRYLVIMTYAMSLLQDTIM